MKQAKVAKLVLIDKDEKYLLMVRSAHPAFGDDPDLPGGTLEEGEVPLDTMIREVYEETGIVVDKTKAALLYEGTQYSTHGTLYSLFMTRLTDRPTVTMSWEHASYEWLDRAEFLERIKDSNDTYMHMVYDVLSENAVKG